MEWLGDVPEHWQQKPIWSLFKRIKRTNFPTERLLSVYRDYGVIPKDSRDDNHNRASEDLTPYQLVCANDLVINKMKAWQGSIAISELRGIVSPAYYIYQPKAEYHSKYIHFLIRSAYYIQSYKNYSKGIRVNQWDLESEAFTHIDLLLPSLDEQQKIVAFLDTETTRIDNLIAKQEKLIELLEEQRKSIISHAVTKGLNPNAPMKDSGVEWLGEVPEHWIISRVKFNFRNLDSKRIPLTSEERSYRQGVYPYYGASGIIDYVNSFIFEEDLVLFSEDGANLAYRSMPIAFVAKGKYWVNNHAHILKPFDNLTAYWACVLESVDVNLSITGATQPKITAENLGNICISFPPSFEERLSINNYILEESLKIDTLILKQNQLIEKLKEYRSSIISHAVTGKIDVREFGA